MVDGFHGDGDVGDGIVDLFLRTGQRLVAEHHLSVALVRAEEGVAVMGDEPTEPLAHIEDAKLRHRSIRPLLLGVPVRPTMRLMPGRTFRRLLNRFAW